MPGRISSKTNNRVIWRKKKYFCSVGTISENLNFLIFIFFFLLFNPLYNILPFRVSDCFCLFFFFFLFSGWRTFFLYSCDDDGIFLRHIFPPPCSLLCMPVCVCMRVECVWLNTLNYVEFFFVFFFFGVGICFLIFGSSIVFNWR